MKNALLTRFYISLNLYTLLHLILTWGGFILCIYANELYETYPKESTYYTLNTKLFFFILGFYLLGNLLFALFPKLEAEKKVKILYLTILASALLISLSLSLLTLRPLYYSFF